MLRFIVFHRFSLILHQACHGFRAGHAGRSVKGQAACNMRTLAQSLTISLVISLCSCSPSASHLLSQELNDIRQIHFAVDQYLMDQPDGKLPRYQRLPTLSELESSGYLNKGDVTALTKERSLEIIYPTAEPESDFVYLRMVGDTKIFEMMWNGDGRVLNRNE